jgi:hypothetical protein
MRVLNVFSGRLEEYFGSKIPKYAILSHTWGRDEVTFSDIHNVDSGARATNASPSGVEACIASSIVVTTTLTDTPRKGDETAETETQVVVPGQDPVLESQGLVLGAQHTASRPTSPPDSLSEDKKPTEMQLLGMYIALEQNHILVIIWIHSCQV